MTDNLSFRKERLMNITATDMAVLFSLNPYESPATIVNRKTSPTEMYGPALRRGQLFEPAVLEAFKIDMGIETIRNNNVTCVLENHRIAATPDAFVANVKERIPVEVKSTGSKRFVKWYLEPPLYYQMQVHTQMLVTNSEKGYLGALEAGDPQECTYRFVAWEIHRNERLEEMMKLETIRFWQSMQSEEKYRANSAMKKEAIELLSNSRKLLYPKDPMVFLETDISEEGEKVRAIIAERYRSCD